MEEILFKKIFSKHLRSKRIQVNYSQARVAEMARIEIAHYGKIERGEILPKAHTFTKISLALELDCKQMMQEYGSKLLYEEPVG